MSAPVRYALAARSPEAHLFEVACSVDDPDPAGQAFRLPTWIPGSYPIREFAKNVVTIRAAAGGKPVACGWITDHFGVSWQIDPKLLIEMTTDPDPVKAGKAMRAMMTMVKIDSEQLKRAVGE